jgi:hypothetical protein
MLLALRAVAISALVTAAVALGGVSTGVQAASPDATPSPAGPVTGVIVIFSPTFPGTAQPGILIVAPTSVGSLLVPVQLPAISGTGPALTQLQIVIPGPNPSQNTPVALGQLLNMVLRPASQSGATGTTAPGSLVSVFATPSH